MQYKKISILFLYQFFAIFLFSQNKTIIGPEMKRLSFIENKGQMKDMNNQPVPFVLFKANAPGMNVYITEKGLTYLFLKSIEDDTKEQKQESQNPFAINTKETLKNYEDENVSVEWHRVDMILKNASIKKENIIKEGASNSFSQYFLSHCKQGITDVRSYEKITIKKIYPGIDWILYNTSDRGFKYDFIIHPHADVNQIKLIYEGSGRLEIFNNQIHFENPIGEMDEGKLFCYQGNETNEIKSSYNCKSVPSWPNVIDKVSNNQHETLNVKKEAFRYEVNIQISEYDKSKILIIDPQLSWATFYGGTGLDGPTSLTTDPTGNVFTTGYVESTDFPVSNAGGTTYYQGTITGLKECFVMKFNNAGALQWATYYGGSDEDQANAICSDGTGNIFVTGFTKSGDFPTLNYGGTSYFQANNAFAGSQDAFILKFTNTGTCLWASYYGGFGDDLGNSICCDPFGNVIIGGQTWTANLPTFAPAVGGYYQAAISGSSEAFILKFNNVGTQLWGTYYGGSNIDIGTSVCTDATGNIYFTGTTRSTDFPVLNPGGTSFFQGAIAGTNYEVFITKFSPATVQLWSTFYGGTAIDEGKSICADGAGNVFVTGGTNSNNFPTLNAGVGTFYQAANGGGNNDAYVLKFDTVGTRLWASYLGGTGDELFNSEKTITIDDCENVYLCINTTSTTMPTKQSCAAGHYYDNSHNGGRDVFITKFSNGGIQQWGTFLGGNGDDFRQAVDVDNAGNLFVGGEWTTENFVSIVSGSYPLTNPGNNALYDASFNGGIDDGYIVKFKPTTINSNTTATPATCICNGTATANGTGGCSPYQYLWYNSSWAQIGNTQTITNLCVGVYHVIVRDSSSCSSPDTSIVTINGSGSQINIIQNITICSGSSYTLPSGNPANSPGVYTDTLLSFIGCDSIITTNLSLINAIIFSQNITLCQGDSIILPSGGSTTSAGQYIDTVNSHLGCDSIITTNVSILQNAAYAQAVSICSGNSYTLPGGNPVSSSGTYYDTLTSSNTCDSIITTSLTVIPAITVSQTVAICSGNNYILPGGTVVNTSGTYNYTTTASNGCDSVITTTLVVNPLPSAIPGQSLLLSCSITSGIISVSTTTMGAVYNWSGPGIVSGGNSFNPTVNAPGTYMVTITDPTTSCTNTATIAVTNSTPLPNVTGAGVILPCNPQTATINASSTTPNVTYSWSGAGIISGGNTNNPIVNSAGTYTVTVIDPLTGCTNTSTAIVTNAPNPSATVSANVTIALGASTILTAGGGNNYSWFPTTNLNPTTGSTVNASPIQTTTYCVEVTDNSGCKDTACVTVSVEIPCPTNENLQLPNAFSPNADGANDEFCLQGWDVCLENFSIVIFDRWGEKVFESKDPNFCWDGTFRNTIMDAQVFVYYIKARFLNLDKPVVKKGNISLIR